MEVVQASEWGVFLSKLQGKGKGNYWAPEPAEDIVFSDFVKLLQAKRVKFMEYANAGKDVAGDKNLKFITIIGQCIVIITVTIPS